MKFTIVTIKSGSLLIIKDKIKRYIKMNRVLKNSFFTNENESFTAENNFLLFITRTKLAKVNQVGIIIIKIM